MGMVLKSLKIVWLSVIAYKCVGSTNEPKKNFRLLNDFFKREATLEERQTFFDSTLPKMQKIVLSSKEYFHRPPQLLKKHSNKEIYLSQQQCGALLGKFQF